MYALARFIYFFSYAFAALLFFSAFFFFGQSYALFLFFLFAGALFLWARFVEPQILTVKKIKLSEKPKISIALLSDMHMGAYKGGFFLRRLVRKVNGLKPDLIFFAGDFLYLSKNPEKDLSPLKNLKQKRALAVLGNHDFDKDRKGVKVNERVRRALKNAGITVLENDFFDYGGFKILALGELWQGKANLDLLKNIENEKNKILLTHNPDVILRFGKSKEFENLIVLAGHTHCGQIRIPFLYKFAIPTKGDFKKGGVYEIANNSKLVISCGLGEVDLPMRLFNPPQILLLEI